MERLVVVWCPSLLVEGERGVEARQFAKVLETAETICPWVEPVRLGVCALPARGPSRFFGGEAAVAARLTAAVSEVLGSRGGEIGAGAGAVAAAGAAGTAAKGAAAAGPRLGVADGLFAATLAARSRVIAGAGRTAEFVAPWSVAVLRRPELAVTLQRLGVHTLGQFAALPPAHVSARFGGDAAACHRVARGEEGELAGLRDPAIMRRLRVVRGELASQGDRTGPDPAETSNPAGTSDPAETFNPVAPTDVTAASTPPRQPGFFGGGSAADIRAAGCFARVQQRLGVESVVVGRLRGGRDPAERAQLVPWGSRDAAAADEGRTARPAAPWPGRLPNPSPVAVFEYPVPVELADPNGRAVGVSGRALLSADPASLSIGGGPWQGVTAWAGPWPCTGRWWSGRRRRARLQVVTAGGAAVLLVAEARGWWLAARYD